MQNKPLQLPALIPNRSQPSGFLMSCEIKKGRVLYRQYNGLLPHTANRLCSMCGEDLLGVDLIIVEQPIRGLRSCCVFACLIYWILRLAGKILCYPYPAALEPSI